MGILEELAERLEIGLGNDTSDWLYMARVKFLDAMLYIAVDYIQVSGDTNHIIHVIDHYNDIDSAKHKMLLWNLFNMLDAIKNTPK